MNFPRFLKFLFLSIFIIQLLGLAVLLVLPQLSQAAGPIKFTPQVDIGTDFKGEQTIGENTIGKYIQAIYEYAIGIVGILATVVMMIGGIIWLTAGGNATHVGEAKSWITASLTGLVLALCSYLILATVNPALTTFKPIKVATVAEIGCCYYFTDSTNTTVTCESKKQNDCSYTYVNYSCDKVSYCQEVVCCLGYVAGSSDALYCENKKIKDCTKEKFTTDTVKVEFISGAECNKFTKGILKIPYYNCK